MTFLLERLKTFTPKMQMVMKFLHLPILVSSRIKTALITMKRINRFVVKIYSTTVIFYYHSNWFSVVAWWKNVNKGFK